MDRRAVYDLLSSKRYFKMFVGVDRIEVQSLPKF